MDINDIEINPLNLEGSVYFGRYTITFKDGYVGFIYGRIYDDGRFKFKDKLDLLRIINDSPINLRSELEFLTAVKKLETKKI